jgi:hypothetical protein
MSKDALKAAFMAGVEYARPKTHPIRSPWTPNEAFEGWYQAEIAKFDSTGSLYGREEYPARQRNADDMGLPHEFPRRVENANLQREESAKFDFDKLPRPDPLNPGKMIIPATKGCPSCQAICKSSSAKCWNCEAAL